MGLDSGHPWPSTVAEKITSASAYICAEVSAQYTLTGTVFFMDEKQTNSSGANLNSAFGCPWVNFKDEVCNPTGTYLRRVPAKLYGVITVFEEP
jgi:hypothetical protein